MNEEDDLLTEREQDQVLMHYSYGGSFQEIVERILHIRNEKIRRDMVKEVGVLVSTHSKRQAYPIEFYGVMEEK
jgi:hypothetical protein